MKGTVKIWVNAAVSILVAGGILWWMYRGFQWERIAQTLRSDVQWGWMLLSFPFGISAQLFRAFRWRQMLVPLGERPRLQTCVNAVFLSYASSLVVPRVGEVLRCGVLSRYEGTNFGKAVGAVVTERVVDMAVVFFFSLLTLLAQIPVFMRFFKETGFGLGDFLCTFTSTGYLVTALCLVLLVGMALIIMRRLDVFSRTRSVMNDFVAGMTSVRKLNHPWLFIFNTLGIWVSYYMHFYLTFYCFGYTENLGAVAALVAFVVGCFAVLVPTPNGAGPWHFSVKTALVLYGVAATDAAVFVLIVHTTQTLLVVLLGLFALVWLAATKRKRERIQ